MSSRLVWLPRAREELMEIYLTIAADKPSAAERWLSAIEQRISLLSVHPRLGVRRPEIGLAARMLVHGSYLVLYEVRPDSDEEPAKQVQIVSVIHGQRESRLF